LDRVLRRRSQRGVLRGRRFGCEFARDVLELASTRYSSGCSRSPTARKPRSTHVVAAMQRGGVANLDAELARLAAGTTKTFFETKLPMATERRTGCGPTPTASCGEIATSGIIGCMKACSLDLRAKIVGSVSKDFSKGRAGR
jgi:hypothetical protein